jgi:hypothetical protein
LTALRDDATALEAPLRADFARLDKLLADLASGAQA